MSSYIDIQKLKSGDKLIPLKHFKTRLDFKLCEILNINENIIKKSNVCVEEKQEYLLLINDIKSRKFDKKQLNIAFTKLMHFINKIIINEQNILPKYEIENLQKKINLFKV